MKTKWMTRNALVASIYVVLTLTPPLNTLSFYAVQFRVSEALLILVWFRKDYAIGILIGTFFANIFGPLGAGFALMDAVFGTIITLFALWIMTKTKSHLVGLIGPILLNGAYLAIFLPFALALPYSFELVAITMLTVSLGEAAVLFGLGLPLHLIIEKQPHLLKLIRF
ncbi:MAG: hypothetical protein RLZZ264_693 [Bacillota bacterium]|jgi:uncharacterized membrane protein